MSLELSGGMVKVNFDLGSGVGSATSANRHNDGRWKSLTMLRNKKQGTGENCQALGHETRCQYKEGTKISQVYFYVTENVIIFTQPL